MGVVGGRCFINVHPDQTGRRLFVLLGSCVSQNSAAAAAAAVAALMIMVMKSGVTALACGIITLLNAVPRVAVANSLTVPTSHRT